MKSTVHEIIASMRRLAGFSDLNLSDMQSNRSGTRRTGSVNLFSDTEHAEITGRNPEYKFIAGKLT